MSCVTFNVLECSVHRAFKLSDLVMTDQCELKWCVEGLKHVKNINVTNNRLSLTFIKY